MWRNAFFWILSAAALANPNAARADELYYMLLFGQQSGNQVDLSHTFATFVRTAGEGQNKTKYDLDIHTISWMPRTLDVKLLRRPEEGVNLSLRDSLRNANALKAEVSMWGPLRIKKEL